MVYSILKEGNNRFVKNLKANKNLLQQINETKECQFPFAKILSCMDSRSSAELVFLLRIGKPNQIAHNHFFEVDMSKYKYFLTFFISTDESILRGTLC